MIFGWYPKIVLSSQADAREYLEILQNNTFYKDIFTLEHIKKPVTLEKLIVFLANNIGTVVRIGSIAREIQTTEVTVTRYIDILEKMFIIKKLPAYSRNPNNEIKGGYKIYFTDIGLRNSIIKNHNTLDIRTDAGAVFENYVIMERIKYLNNHRIFVNNYFWQNYKQGEVDYLEEYLGYLYAYEYKLSHRKSRAMKLFHAEYKDVIKNTEVITLENYSSFITSSHFPS
jgi:predicted AAA+ superfamily ATPase